MTDEGMQKLYQEAYVIKQKLGTSMDVAVMFMILAKLVEMSNGNN